MTTRETVIPAALWYLRSLYLLTPASFCHLHRWLSVSGQYSFSILHEGKLKWESICGCVQLVCHFTTMSKTNIIIVHLCSFAPYPSPSVFWLLSWWLPFLVLVDCCQVTATNTHSQHACTHAQELSQDRRTLKHTHTHTILAHKRRIQMFTVSLGVFHIFWTCVTCIMHRRKSWRRDERSQTHWMNKQPRLSCLMSLAAQTSPCTFVMSVFDFFNKMLLITPTLDHI